MRIVLLRKVDINWLPVCLHVIVKLQNHVITTVSLLIYNPKDIATILSKMSIIKYAKDLRNYKRRLASGGRWITRMTTRAPGAAASEYEVQTPKRSPPHREKPVHLH